MITYGERRKLRLSLGTRTNRRKGVKGRKRELSADGTVKKFARPRVLLAELIRKRKK